MKKYFLVFLFFTLGTTVFAQELKVHKTDGTVASFLLSQIDSITFTSSSIIPTEGLVAYYPFNGNANDESGNGNNGTVYGSTLTTDRFGSSNNAYSFDGINDYIDISSNSFYNINSQITILGWAYRTSLRDVVILSRRSSANCQYQLTWCKDFYGIRLDLGPGIINYSSNVAHYEIGSWHFIAASFDGNNVKLYFDGALDAVIQRTSAIGSYNANVSIGTDNVGHFSQGIIDDIRIYNRTLNEAEIQQIYHEGGWEK